MQRIYYSHTNNLQTNRNHQQWIVRSLSRKQLFRVNVTLDTKHHDKYNVVVVSYHKFWRVPIFKGTRNNNNPNNLVAERHLLHYYHLNERYKLSAMLNTFKTIFRFGSDLTRRFIAWNGTQKIYIFRPFSYRACTSWKLISVSKTIHMPFQ